MTPPSEQQASGNSPVYAIIVPICNEEECLGAVLDELLEATGPRTDIVISVGINGTTDSSREIARERGVILGEATQAGYGHGCVAGMEAVLTGGRAVKAWIFMAGDGANDPADLLALLARYEAGADLVLGNRTTRLRNWRRPWMRSVANLVVGAWATALTGRIYVDLGPFRVIDRQLMERMQMREHTWGWTIEPQILAMRLGARVDQISVAERDRMGGQQKVTGVSLRHTFRIGWHIMQAGWRSRWRPLN